MWGVRKAADERSSQVLVNCVPELRAMLKLGETRGISVAHDIAHRDLVEAGGASADPAECKY